MQIVLYVDVKVSLGALDICLKRYGVGFFNFAKVGKKSLHLQIFVKVLCPMLGHLLKYWA